MNGELLAVETARVYTATPKVGSLGLPAPVSGFGIVETVLPRLKASSLGCIGGAVSFVPLLCTSSAGHTLTSGSGSISATASKVVSDTIKPLRENDEGSCTGSQASTAGTIICNCTMKIQSAGQQKAKCL